MSGLSSSAWFTGDDGPADPPSERRAPPAAAPVTAARTLPVTPAERACATVLRAYLAWNSDAAPAEPIRKATGCMMRLGDLLAKEELVVWDEGSLTPAGAALLDRVEAAPAPDPMIAFEAAIRDAVAKGGPYGNTHAREAVAALDAARLAGTTPIDAPPASPERHPRPVPRQECARCDQFYSQGTGGIGPCKDSPYRHGKDGPGWRDPLHKWDTIDAPPAKEPR